MAPAALVLYGVWFVLAFGVRTVIQVRRTGDTGFKGLGGRAGSLEWFAGVLFTVAPPACLRRTDCRVAAWGDVALMGTARA
jgi:hypothetical protein